MTQNITRKKYRLLVLASGDKDGGGSGYLELLENTAPGGLLEDVNIVGVISNHARGGVYKIATGYGQRFIHLPREEACQASYQNIVESCVPDFIALSGWVLHVEGLDPRITFNIHPALLNTHYPNGCKGPRLGGQKMYGHFVHEAVKKAFDEGLISVSGPSMHWATLQYDDSEAVFFQFPHVYIRDEDTPKTIASRVNAIEHSWQPLVTSMVIHGQISWDGIHPESLRVPDWYKFHLPVMLEPPGKQTSFKIEPTTPIIQSPQVFDLQGKM